MSAASKVIVDVKKLRQSLRMSQPQFADSYGFNVATLRKWEQGVRHPVGPARTLLIVISRSPDVVRDALSRAA